MSDMGREEMKFFKAEDFEGANLVKDEICLPSGIKMECYSPKKAADLANSKLEREGKRVYSMTRLPSDEPQQWSHQKLGTPRYQALLIAIEPIEKKCEHQPFRTIYEAKIGGSGPMEVFNGPLTCLKCGKKLKATFQECE